MEATTSWGWINWLVVALYLIGVLAFGFLFSSKKDSTKEYFLGGGRIPAWVSGLSIYSTMLSSISYLAIPASIFRNGLVIGTASLGTIPLAFWVVRYVVPVFRSVDAVTGYEYLEKRFKSPFFRYVGSLSFSLFHLARIGLVLYLPAIALMIIFPGASIITLTVATALVCVFYTTTSGIAGVAWLDAIQAIILIVGMIIMAWVGFSYIPEQGLWAALQDQGKAYSAQNFAFALSNDSMWALVIGHGIFSSIYSYIGSQDVIQRYSITSDEKEAKKAVLFNVPMLLVSVVMFTLMGAALIIFFNYSGHVLPDSISGNAIVPYFIFNFLPVGLSGLVVVGILAATQSTISSSINSLATCVANDILLPKSTNEKLKVKVGMVASAVSGLLGTALAYYLIIAGQGDAFKLFAGLTGLFGGPLAAIFLLAIFCDRAGKEAGYVCLLVAIAVSFYLANPLGLGYTPIKVSPFLIAFVIISIGLVAGIIASYIFPAPKRDEVNNLTYKTVMENRRKVR
ncbi:sodium:solute symporter family transporter [Psittacicella gerlachiana]|uniref:Na+/proline symporter n=1 Tax=Psittacicella gerlachiana TaxID=2028574 RepID=A0A3A1YCY7_9GAMM|nr:sodium/solute symporter [Psittacicella gerlachiana]RIY35048.1 hypothetical protein CKF59_04210 [Psittacicella gerlachiana]